MSIFLEKNQANSSSYGFTLIETMIVIVIVGILAAISGPSWINFINQRKVGVVNDATLRALQTAQQEAKKTKRSYSISFLTENTTKIPKFFVYPVNTTPPSTDKWSSLVQDLERKPGQPVPVITGTNLSSENTASTSFSYASTTAQTITFDFKGNLLTSANLGINQQGLIIVVGVPQAANSTLPIDSSRRCVKVMTLLGALQTGRENECNTS